MERLKHIPDIKDLKELAKVYPDVCPDAILALTRFLVVAGEVERAMECHFSHYSLSRARFSLLMCLYLGPREGLIPSAIAERMKVTRGNMTGLIDGLLEAGYVLKEDDPQDRRIIRIKLSKSGFKFLAKMLPDHFARTSKAFSVMTKKDIDAFSEFLNKLEAGIRLIGESWKGAGKNK